MSRTPFQVLIIPFRRVGGRIEYAIFRRADDGSWQAIAGGGEDDETPLQAAQREAFEEGGMPQPIPLFPLSSMATVPAINFANMIWGPDVVVVPEYCFGVDVTGIELSISREHTEYCWAGYDNAVSLLRYDSNKNALWELNFRLESETRY